MVQIICPRCAVDNISASVKSYYGSESYPILDEKRNVCKGGNKSNMYRQQYLIFSRSRPVYYESRSMPGRKQVPKAATVAVSYTHLTLPTNREV